MNTQEQLFNALEEIKDLNKTNLKLKKELSDLKELILKTINIFENALNFKEAKP